MLPGRAELGVVWWLRASEVGVMWILARNFHPVLQGVSVFGVEVTVSEYKAKVKRLPISKAVWLFATSTSRFVAISLNDERHLCPCFTQLLRWIRSHCSLIPAEGKKNGLWEDDVKENDKDEEKDEEDDEVWS